MNQKALIFPIAILLTGMALGGCDRREGPKPVTSASAESDALVVIPAADAAASQSDPNRVLADARQATRDVGQEMKEAGDKISANLKQVSQEASDKVGDAVITAAVKAELAKDQSLSATQINVDTNAGRVTMAGAAPSEVARERATQLALSVKGVIGVDNKLIVKM